MKRKTLTTAVLAGLTGVAGMAGVANAVHLNPDGLGQVLLYPYYSAKGGNDTLISVVNTTDQAKSVKIRFIEALNSREVLDFNIYMSAFDVWSAAITATEAGGGKIVIADRTCTATNFHNPNDPNSTIDENGNANVLFRNFQFIGQNADGGPTGIDRTASGYIEVIEMGTLVGDAATMATHVGGEPANCNALNALWTQGPWGAGQTELFHEPPSGGLFGSAAIINVEDGTMFSYNADALDAFTMEILHTDPASLRPNLQDGGNISNVFLPGALAVDTQVWDDPIDAVNAAIMHNAIMNEYVIRGGASARSEWIITFPTKRFHADGAPGGPQVPAPIPPFTSLWTPASPGACEDVDFRVWDREERTTTTPGQISPPPVTETVSICREANVWRFSSDGSVPDVAEITKEEFRADGLGYTNFDISEGFTSGWGRFDFSGHASRPALETGDRYIGLPVIGFWVNTFTNGTLQDAEGADVLANYGGSFRHRGTRAVLRGS